MPSDVVGIVAHEVTHVQCFPQGFLCLMWQRMQGKLLQGFGFACFHLRARIGRTAAESAQRELVQIFQQLAFPSIPHLG